MTKNMPSLLPSCSSTNASLKMRIMDLIVPPLPSARLLAPIIESCVKETPLLLLILENLRIPYYVPLGEGLQTRQDFPQKQYSYPWLTQLYQNLRISAEELCRPYRCNTQIGTVLNQKDPTHPTFRQGIDQMLAGTYALTHLFPHIESLHHIVTPYIKAQRILTDFDLAQKKDNKTIERLSMVLQQRMRDAPPATKHEQKGPAPKDEINRIQLICEEICGLQERRIRIITLMHKQAPKNQIAQERGILHQTLAKADEILSEAYRARGRKFSRQTKAKPMSWDTHHL